MSYTTPSNHTVYFLVKHFGEYASNSGVYYAAYANLTVLKNMGYKSATLVTCADESFLTGLTLASDERATVIVEGAWCAPDLLHRVAENPNISIIVRLHSKWSFMSANMVSTLRKIVDLNFQNCDNPVRIAFNESSTMHAFRSYIRRLHELRSFTEEDAALKAKEIDFITLLLPNDTRNMTLPNKGIPTLLYNKTAQYDILRVACFGELRPMKNTVTQALAAINAADSLERKLEFHVNTSLDSDPVLIQVRDLFKEHPHHKLIEHLWVNINKLYDLIYDCDVNLACSFSETFSMVAALGVLANTPTVGAPSISWLSSQFIAQPDNVFDISRLIQKFVTKPLFFSNTTVKQQTDDLMKYLRWSENLWKRQFPPFIAAGE